MIEPFESVDPELGPLRLCPDCQEWWPSDTEFYAPGARSCRACVADRRDVELRRKRNREAARRWRIRNGQG